MTSGLLAPSILSADFSRLGEEIRTVESAGADWLHVDVMDGHFVPNLTLGPVVVEKIKPVTGLPLDCHLMVSQPELWIAPFAKAGAQVITIHVEATNDLIGLLKKIRALGCKAGVSIKPGTSVEVIAGVLDHVDLVLVMSVEPGFGGQKFMEDSLDKVKKLVQSRQGRRFLIEIDGGINLANVAKVRQAGVDVVVAGNAIFGAKDVKQAITDMKNLLRG